MLKSYPAFSGLFGYFPKLGIRRSHAFVLAGLRRKNAHRKSDLCPCVEFFTLPCLLASNVRVASGAAG